MLSRAKQSQSIPFGISHYSTVPSCHRSIPIFSCETNPIPSDPEYAQAPCSKGFMNDSDLNWLKKKQSQFPAAPGGMGPGEWATRKLYKQTQFLSASPYRLGLPQRRMTIRPYLSAAAVSPKVKRTSTVEIGPSAPNRLTVLTSRRFTPEWRRQGRLAPHDSQAPPSVRA